MQDFVQEYYDKHQKSLKMYDKAKNWLPNGVDSNIRAFKPFPLFFDHGQGGRVWDVDGNEIVDCQLAYGPLMVGHCHPVITEATKAQIDKGIAFATPIENEATLCELLKDRFPFMELTRFSCSGTEATMHALRVARGYTRKDKIIKLEGGYHGAHDDALVSVHNPPEQGGPDFAPVSVDTSDGMPANVKDNVLVVPFNNAEALERVCEANRGKIAAFILEPAMTNSTFILERNGYLKKVREICTRENIVLIFDEVISGCRASYGGIAQVSGVTPDMITLSKAIGGGYTISALGGKREIMSVIGNGTYHCGTFGGNPLSVAASIAALRDVMTPEASDKLFKKSDQVFEEMRSILKKSGIPFCMEHMGAMGSIVFGTEDVYDYRSMHKFDEDMWFKFFITMLNKGVLMIGADPTETIFFSFQHTDKDYEYILKAFQETIDTL